MLKGKVGAMPIRCQCRHDSITQGSRACVQAGSSQAVSAQAHLPKVGGAPGNASDLALVALQHIGRHLWLVHLHSSNLMSCC